MFRNARAKRRAYDLICLDIMPPEMDGQTLLREIRAIEDGSGTRGKRAKIIMTTALGDFKNVSSAFWELCDEYLVKPTNRYKLLQHLGNLGLLPGI
jgi:two-component system, chemotaxis family, chemotaxis protein CheY